ncbi:MAG: anti-sigma factor antagonist [Candidatus Margulisbacteria bacterium]|nr:anti-sigma factor antagonist [Candidatus Margulisiibacteriota bacterium]
MEIIKKQINKNLIKINLGTDLNTETSDVIGSVELDIETQAQFIEMITVLLEAKNLYIILDMSNISYIDSSGLWSLFESQKKAEQKYGKIVLLNPTKDVARVLDVTKMSTKINVFTNETDAIKSFPS